MMQCALVCCDLWNQKFHHNSLSCVNTATSPDRTQQSVSGGMLYNFAQVKPPYIWESTSSLMPLLNPKLKRLTGKSLSVKNCVDMCTRHGRGAIEICLSEKGARDWKIGKHWSRQKVIYFKAISLAC